jgi:fructose-specific phosphotransferase system IIA component
MVRNILDEQLIIINPEVKDKNNLFQRMVHHVYQHDYIRHEKEFFKSLVEREKMANTELIPGVALPHARSNAVEKLFLCIITSKKGIDYENKEMGPAHIIFFLGSNHQHHKAYLQLLAQTSRLLKNEEFRHKIIHSESKEEIIELLSQYIEKESDSTEAKNYTLLLTLHDIHKSNDVLSSLAEAGITNATIIDASSMARKMAYEIPIFAGLSYLAQGKSKESQLFFSNIVEKKSVEHLISILKDNGIDLQKKGVGFLQLIPVDFVYGNYEEDVDL